jgi:uncharacterized repeat protein (TIGR03803 family)
VDLRPRSNEARRPASPQGRPRYFPNALLLLSVLIAALSLIPAGPATAQTFTTLYSFTNGSDGANPEAGLILSGNTLYGTTIAAGASGGGTVFKVNTDGTGFATVHNFINGSDGSWSEAGLILSSNTLYGTASGGGAGGSGTVFQVNTDGTGFATLYRFTNGSDGDSPEAGLILSGNTLYGTAAGGGTSHIGTVFQVNTDGTGFATLHSFTGTNSDGANPWAGLILSSNTLYGTTGQGGTSGDGTVFQVNTDGAGFATLHSFTGGSDGNSPSGGLILSGNILYGTARSGGTSGGGTVFQVNTDGTGFATLYSFTNGSDGDMPLAGLILSGNTLYGTTFEGGTGGGGTVFQVNTDGTGFATLYSLNGSDGSGLWAGLILSGNTLYGTAEYGGTSGDGTVFSISLPLPQLAIIQSGTNVVLSWPTNFTGLTLQSTTNLVSPAVWTPVSPAPVVVNGQNTVTNPISGTQQFFRLR